jgi:tight adherence protein B
MPLVALFDLVVRLVRRWRIGARRTRQFPDALDRMAAALRTGSSIPQALGDAAAGSESPLGRELARLAHETNQGRALHMVLDDWVVRHDDSSTRLSACALAMAAATGAAPARALDGVAATLRDRLDMAQERRTLATQARTSAVVLSAMPVAFTAILGLGQADSARFLLRTPAGWACLVVGLSLDAIGAVCMWRMTRGAR